MSKISTFLLILLATFLLNVDEKINIEKRSLKIVRN